jgi:excisionase family DNA binding protein
MAGGQHEVTVTEAAAILGRHRNRVLQLIAAGRLPARRIGPILVLPRAAVHAFARLKRPAGKPVKIGKKSRVGDEK